jgi:regulator of protease activity HflC (stomatin/prohibitin superfamily)
VDSSVKRIIQIAVVAVILIFGLVFLLGGSIFGFQKVKIPQGYVGLKFKTLGAFSSEVLSSGYHITRPGTDIIPFPTFQQTYIYTKSKDEGNPTDESFNFALSGGVSCTANLAVNYHVEPTKVALIYQKYQTGLEGITHTFLRYSIRDAFNNIATTHQVDSMMFGAGKEKLLKDVRARVSSEFAPYGIIVDNIQLASDFSYPAQITQGILAKNAAIQNAQIQENNARTSVAKATADSIVTAGVAKSKIVAARGDSASSVIAARGHAEAIRVESSTLTQTYIDYTKAKNWNGVLPTTLGGFQLLRDSK